MKTFLFLFTLLSFKISYGQQKICGCKTDETKSGTANCKTIILKNRSKLYYQFNCDSVWLTLENRTGKKKIIYSSQDFLEYTYRIGYQLAKEYNHYLLFRSGCPANGPCNFILIDKTSGKKVKEFGELIYDHECNRFYKFVIYFSNTDLNSLTLYYIDTKKRYFIPINPEKFAGVIPEYAIDVSIINNKLNIKYGYGKKDFLLPGGW